MPGTYTYPGVYVEEVPSGVRTIMVAGTSTAAFVDFFKQGPLDEPRPITSWGDFERIFGGLDGRSESSYAIQQFYLNGGSTAWVVRVASDAQAATTTLVADAYPSSAYQGQVTLTVEAASPGAWGNGLAVAIDHNVAPGSDAFNLAVARIEGEGQKAILIPLESHRNLSMDKSDSRYVKDVIAQDSALIRLSDSGANLPAADADDVITAPLIGQFQSHLLMNGTDGKEPGAELEEWELGAGAAAIEGSEAKKTGIYALDKIAPSIFNLMCLPAAAKFKGGTMRDLVSKAIKYCTDQRAFFIVDIDKDTNTLEKMQQWMKDNDSLRSNYAAVYFPRVKVSDPLNERRPRDIGASGTLAGIYARTDANRGVWKAPAGTASALRSIELAAGLTDLQNGLLNPLGINVLRNFPIYGNVSWGARTLHGADQMASEWKYIPIRRTALMIEESLYQGLKWVVFEPNDEPLWSQVRLNVGAFMHTLFRQGAFQGSSPREAYLVKCDAETTTQTDRNMGIVNIHVGFAPLKPAEFVVIKIQQLAGQIEA